MEKICVSTHAKERILKNINNEGKHKIPIIKYGFAAAACFALIFSATALYKNMRSPGEPPDMQGGVIDYVSIDELSKNLSFTLKVPQYIPENFSFESASDQFGMALIIYSSGKEDIRYYMAEGENALTQNDGTMTETNGGKYTILEGEYITVQFKDSKYSYCTDVSGGIDAKELEKMLESLK